MPNLLHMTGLQMKHGDSVEIQGRIIFSASRFSIDLGKDLANLGLHFNPRFTANETRIILNNTVNHRWRGEQVEKSTLQNNTDFKVHITFTQDNFEIVISDETTLMFPNRSGLDMMKEFWINGDFQLKSVKWNNSGSFE